MKKNKSSKNWVNAQHKDKYFKQSKIQGFRSRSAFKLIEMNEKFKFLNKKTNLLDLGSSPGGWSQVASKKISKGKILAIDLKLMEKINNVEFLKGDMLSPIIYKRICKYFNKSANVVISDMASNTSGNKNLDSHRTGELCLKAIDLAKEILNKDGIFLSKLFMGSIFTEIYEKAARNFEKVIRYKPLSSKKKSKEIYIYCKGVKKTN